MGGSDKSALDPTWIRGGSDSGSDIKRWRILEKSTQILSYPHQDCSSLASFFHCRSNLFCQSGSYFLYPMPPERPAGKARAKARPKALSAKAKKRFKLQLKNTRRDKRREASRLLNALVEC